MKDFIDVSERPSNAAMLPLSFQHLFAMFGSTVLVPYLLKADPATALFMNGIGTILYLFICKGKIPSYLGSSFAFIAPVLSVMAAGMSYEAAQGGFIAFGLAFIVLSFIVRAVGIGWIDVLFPPAAMGAIIAVIGLELGPVAMGMAGITGDSWQTLGMTHAQVLTISLFSLIVTILGTVVFRGFFAVIPVLIGVVSGYILAAFMGVVDFSKVSEAAWFSLPHMSAPVFNINAILMIMPALFVVFAEHVGHLVVTSNIVGRDLMKDPGLQRSLLGDGIANVLSGFFGATPNTTYGENIGVLAITRVFSVYVIGGAAVLAIIFSFIGKIAALIHAIPVPVMGGVSILLFGIIAASGLRMLVERKVDYTRPDNLILTSVVMITGLSGAQVTLGPVVLQGMGLATVVAIVLSLCFTIFRKTGLGNKQLKHD
ncbi:uracil permease [Veillonella criceti]|uniref:Uracil transporter n=1 Tax=Veillonella criceti TaxID=103891 RepID=A0A380NKT0_9FIRM|nr:uracil permease [Veillonella criceti]SUP42869.1 Uracil transporter [Veillonella criceti]